MEQAVKPGNLHACFFPRTVETETPPEVKEPIPNK